MPHSTQASPNKRLVTGRRCHPNTKRGSRGSSGRPPGRLLGSPLQKLQVDGRRWTQQGPGDGLHLRASGIRPHLEAFDQLKEKNKQMKLSEDAIHPSASGGAGVTAPWTDHWFHHQTSQALPVVAGVVSA